MSTVALWYVISDEARAKLRRLLPRSWHPPKRDGRPVTVYGQVEDVSGLARLMSQAPNQPIRKDEVPV